MTPEYPVEIPEGSMMVKIRYYFQSRDLECAMLRAGVSCGNTAEQGIALNGGSNIVIPICDMCIDDMALAGPEQTANWRAQQREWGVR